MNDGGHMHGASPPHTSGTMAATDDHHAQAHGGRDHMSEGTMHMSFFWGKNAEILFHSWPGEDRLGMYVLALLLVFFTAVTTEWLSHCKFLWRSTNRDKPSGFVLGLIETALYGVRIGLTYLVMLSVMSFNVGVFLAAIGGHGFGFLLFGSRVFKKSDEAKTTSSDVVTPSDCC